MNVTRLDERGWQATFVEPIRRVTDGGPVVDFWPYFEAIPTADFEGYDCTAGEVNWVYRMANQYEHVMVQSTTPNVFMAIVLDLEKAEVAGHKLVDHNEIYGLDPP